MLSHAVHLCLRTKKQVQVLPDPLLSPFPEIRGLDWDLIEVTQFISQRKLILHNHFLEDISMFKNL